MPFEGLVVHDPDPEAQIREFPVQGRNGCTCQREARRAHPDPHQAGDLVPAFPNILFQTRNIGKDNLPRLPLSINKLDIEFFFEFLQAHTQRRLRNVQGFRRFADLSLFDNRAKIL